METVKMKIRNKKSRRKALSVGSALILAVVLTSLLAIIGVLFLMASRVNKIAASAISQTRELDLAVDAVVAQIAEELALDVPRIDPNTLTVLQEYYDYPDANNAWLADFEPFKYGPGDYRWGHVSDLYYRFEDQRGYTLAKAIPEYQDTVFFGLIADADGDGVTDSRWVELPDVTSSKGWSIYVAVRVIDNGAMLNVNTAYKFGPAEVLDRIDGSSQMQIDLMALASQPGEPDPTMDHESDLLEARANYPPAGVDPTDSAALAAYLDAYEENVVWRYSEPNGPYTPFDISDELELRYRFLVNQDDIDSRLEMLGFADNRSWGFRTIRNFRRPVEGGELDEWFITAYGGMILDPNYAYRRIATTYNMDRIIAPDGGVMLNVNTADKYALRDRITTALRYRDPGFPGVSAAASQVAANLIDFRDEDEFVTAVDDVDFIPHYGFERPCVYISELVHKYVFNPLLDITGRSYAIELYKPYFEDSDPIDWQLVIDGEVYDVNWSGTRRFHVIKWEDPNAPLPVSFYEPSGPNPPGGAEWVDPKLELSWPVSTQADTYDVYLGTTVNDVNLIVSDLNETTFKITDYDPCGLETETVYYWRVDDVNGLSTWEGEVWWFTTGPADYNYSEPNSQYYSRSFSDPNVFNGGSIIELRRIAENGVPVVVDSVQVPQTWESVAGQTDSFQRDITLHKCIRRLWDFGVNTATLGYTNGFRDLTEPNIMIQAHPYLDPDIYGINGIKGFRNIGEIGVVFRSNAYTQAQDPMVYPPDIIGYNNEIEEDVRINLADADYQQLLNFLTVFDPAGDAINNDGDPDTDEFDVDDDGYPDPGDELKIPGRININTAPWYVIAQLPWVRPELAQAIVAYRDKLELLPDVVDYTGFTGGVDEALKKARAIGMWELYNATPPLSVYEARGFAEVAELLNVTHDLAEKGGDSYDPRYDIRRYCRDINDVTGADIDQWGFPDLTWSDGAANDFEERDLIFARISNLVTVRSDVFTAYILVRIGPDGPQKRVMAILDRSDVYPDGLGGVTGRVRIRALHPVPDPR